MAELHEKDRQLGELPRLSEAHEAFEITETMTAIRNWLASGPITFCARGGEQHYLFYRGSVWRSRKSLSSEEWVLCG
jgi:hypothetical protein